ncbi:MAG: hypothetical protein V4654_08290 [Bdellovibrionota bacterium]
MKFKTTLLFLFMSCSSFAAEQYIKNSLPCINNICLGDDLSSLEKVSWETKKLRSKPSLSKIKRIYRGNEVSLQNAAFYLDKGFDNEGLKVLKEVKVACQSQSVSGKFMTENGNPTVVTVALLPTKNPSEQRWTVTNISRAYPSAVSNQQKTEVINQLKERYASIIDGKNKKSVMTITPIIKLTVTFLLVDGLVGMNEQLIKHPLCGGASKVSID